MHRTAAAPAAGLAALLAALVAAAYAGTLREPFVFDDVASIIQNPYLQGIASSFRPPFASSTLVGRPLVGLSLGLNHAVSGNAVWSYHAFNLAVHVLAALVLFDLARRTLLSAALAARFGTRANGIAFACAAFWALHPLQTESVTYTVQRAESLCGLFYLLTLYFLCLAHTSARPRLWLGASIAACAAGAATKEVIATAPILALLYDRTFLAGSFGEALKWRRRYYAGLTTCWIVLLVLLASGGWNRGGVAGFATVPLWRFWLTQVEAVGRYMALTLWPAHQAFDYGPHISSLSARLAGCGAVLLAVLVAAVWALRRAPAAGFLFAWFFVVLAPTCVVPVATQTIAEHRMYLALAAPAAAAACLLFAFPKWQARSAAALVCVALGSLTFLRNETYASPVLLWGDAARARPANARALGNYGLALFEAGRQQDAIAALEASVAVEPRDQGPRNNLGNALAASGQRYGARREYLAALAIQPDFAPALFDLAKLSEEEGDAAEAAAGYRKVLQASPGNAAAEFRLGSLLAGTPAGLDEGLAHLRRAALLDPNAPVHIRLGEVLDSANRPREAEAEFAAALAADPRSAQAHYELGLLLYSHGRVPEGIHQLSEAAQADPAFAKAHLALGNAFALEHHGDDAEREFAAAVKAEPSLAEADLDWGILLVGSGRRSEALAHFEAAIRSQPNLAQAHYLRALILVQLGRGDESAADYEALLRLGSPLADKLVRVVQGKD
ncbi:MAG TPA: tetratricopeptide repeat protein [Opitutaceae bacterium]